MEVDMFHFARRRWLLLSLVLLGVPALGGSTLRALQSAISDAVDEARDADNRCRGEVLDLLKDAKADARDMSDGDQKAIRRISEALDKAAGRAKRDCDRRVTNAIRDALDSAQSLAAAP